MPQAETESSGEFLAPWVHEARDSFERLDDLMLVIEAFATTWPVRGVFRQTDLFLL
jgi:hypothetical protein